MLSANHASGSRAISSVSQPFTRQLRTRRERNSATTTMSSRLTMPVRDPVATSVASSGALNVSQRNGCCRQK